MRFICILCCIAAMAIVAGCDGSSDRGVVSSTYYGAGGSLPGNCCGN